MYVKVKASHFGVDFILFLRA